MQIIFIIIIYPMEANRNIKIYDAQSAVIQLVGDMKENIEQLIQSISCKCGINGHLRAILTIYTNKIIKLRSQRDLYKKKYQQLLCESSTNIQILNQSHNPQAINDTLSNYLDTNKQQQSNELLVCPSKFRGEEQSASRIQPIQQTNYNNQDSLLLTQSSCNRFDSSIKKSSQGHNLLAKSFEQFLLQKVQENHTKLKITQDLQALTNRKKRAKSPKKKPLSEKFKDFFV